MQFYWIKGINLHQIEHMRKLLSFLLVTLFAATSVFAQESKKKERASPHETVIGNHIQITYGRPYMKGRVIFGNLVELDKVWRTGADEATQITFDKDCSINGRPLKAGTYTLFTIPGKVEWMLILNSKLGQWGAYSYEENKKYNVIEAALGSKDLTEPVEQFTIKIENDGVRMEWEKKSVYFGVQF